ncbi:hypothetical protein Bca4012_009878 [Brassica carinata]|uniref:Uncharacterized protein n=1 Tax=Brassica carinata TaxID=52824 RepID=A0A8X7S2S9_BRACI|nr:hypothetical protein Bca52824_035104 [Brassica carinata]
MDGLPGFPPLFPELYMPDRKMAMLYILHSDETERQVRILCMQHAIIDNARNPSAALTSVTPDLDKGKGLTTLYNFTLEDPIFKFWFKDSF